MELRHLLTFVAVAEEGSFTRAADRLHVVQSAVSTTIRSLERDLGAVLFDRTTHRVSLTDAGLALLPAARNALEAARAAREAVELVMGGVSGTVVVGAMQAQAMRALDLAAIVDGFRRSHPLVNVLLRHVGGGSAQMADDVRDGRLDMAFIAVPETMSSGLTLFPLASEEMRLVVPRAHPLARSDAVRLEDLRSETFVDVPGGWGTRMASDRAFARAKVKRRLAYELSDAAAVIEFVRRGLGVTLMPPSVARGVEGLVLVPVLEHAPKFETSIAISNVRRPSAAATALLHETRLLARSMPHGATGGPSSGERPDGAPM